MFATAFSLAAGALGGALLAAPAGAQPVERALAACAGRLSALTEFQWLTDGPASDATARERDAMVTLAEAAAAPGMQVQLMDWRITAKAAQAALLRQAAFGRDPLGVAARRSDELIAGCRAMVLG